MPTMPRSNLFSTMSPNPMPSVGPARCVSHDRAVKRPHSSAMSMLVASPALCNTDALYNQHTTSHTVDTTRYLNIR
jgi:hypothetical protein